MDRTGERLRGEEKRGGGNWRQEGKAFRKLGLS